MAKPLTRPQSRQNRAFLAALQRLGNVRLAQVMEREKAPLGVFITAENPTRAMEADAAAVGRFEDEWGRTYPRLQILTLAELFQGRKPDIPFVDPASLKRAKREDEAAGKQRNLL